MPGDALPDRVRTALAGRAVREVNMFGGICFMVEEHMVVAARSGGDLLVRVDPNQHDQLAARTGAKPAMMGAHRPMGDGWLAVAQEALADDGLTEWLNIALEYHAAQSTRT